MSFHEYGGNVEDDVHILIPQWVIAIGNENADIFFTDKDWKRNKEYLRRETDEEYVLDSRIALEVIHLLYLAYSFIIRMQLNFVLWKLDETLVLLHDWGKFENIILKLTNLLVCGRL